jgi:hypothetical protein
MGTLSHEETSAKFAEFEIFLKEIDKEYADELKERGGIKNYIAYGVFNNKVTYNPRPELPAEIEGKIKNKLKELFP